MLHDLILNNKNTDLILSGFNPSYFVKVKVIVDLKLQMYAQLIKK